MPDRSLTKLQALLRDLFQFDLSDLDFGIYRLLRLKRDEVEAFLSEQLPRRVDEVFAGAAGEERKRMQEEVAELAERIRKDIDEEALLPTGDVKPDFRETKVKKARELIQKYEEKRAQLQSIEATEEQKAHVFNHLYAFFARYYDEGDFISKRRYGSRETYAVPYNGEETYFHWANKDQHYIKTAEHFRDYSFTVDAMGKTYRVRFALTEASLPPGNTKGDTRYFFPQHKEATFDKESLTLRLPFHYRLLTEAEVEKLGKNSKLQEAVLQGELKNVLKAVPEEALRGALNEVVDKKENEDVTLLLKRLRHFCRRNTSDFFVHKNLEGFLKQELEFYLKDQLLHIADLEADFEPKRRTLRVMRELAHEMIQFLAQIENVQKRLFEKKKFVLRADYLIPIQNVPKELWKVVLANKAQLEEWKQLYALDPKETLFTRKGEVNDHFLEEHPTLVVNTAHFGREFTLKALAAFEDLEEATDGLLIHAENYQALRLLAKKFEGKVKCIHIDPPYNTQTSGFLYKNTYQHSSWLAMMGSRIDVSARLMTQDGAYLCHIDENEYELLHLLFTYQGIADMGTVVWDKKNPMLGRKGVATQHEYIIWRSRSDSPPYLRSANVPIILSKAESLIREHGGVNEKVRKEFAAWVSNHEALSGGERAYRLIDNVGRVFRGVAMGAPEPRKDPKFHIPLIHPITKKACPVPNNGWSRTPETLQQLVEKDEILFGEDETAQPQRKVFLTEESKRQVSSVIADAMRGKTDLIKLGLEFPYCHPVSLYEELIGAAAPDESGAVLDHFAGSGTTAHAVINLNREDGGQRKFILTEIGDYFDTVLLPRIQKVIYTPEWKDGKPVRPATKEEAERTPRLVKVLRLEGYEDALHNLTTEETLKREQRAAKAHKEKLGAETYRLRYLARLPLEANASMLNLEKLEHPFNYTIEILTEDGPKAEKVDLVETFNYLYAIDVRRIETWVNEKDKREYRVVKGKNREGRSVLVLWRDMGNLDPKVERAFLEAKTKTEGPFDEMLINGDTATPGFVSLDPVFKRLVEEEER